MSEKHTPGPWVRRGREIAKYGADWACIAVLCNPRQNIPDGGAPSEPLSADNPRFAEGIANGDLMKAAPAMLAALEAVRAFLVDSPETRQSPTMFAMWVRNLEAAIAAARGE